MFSRLAGPAAEKFEREYRSLLEPALREPPDVGSEEEARCAAKMANLTAALLQELGESSASLAQSDLAEQIDVVLKDEYKAADPLIKLSYRHLSASLEVYYELFSMFSVHSEAAAAAFSMFEQLDEEEAVQTFLVDPVTRSMSSMLFSVCAALETREESAAKLAFWAKRAVAEARNVRPRIRDFERGLRALGTRQRALGVWDEWDDDEVEHELSSWKTLSDPSA